MTLVRILLGLVALAAAAAAVGGLLFAPAEDLGSLWHSAAPESLNLTQAVTQRYIHPAVWTHGILPVLLMPAAGVFITVAVLAMLLLTITLLPERRRRRTR